MQQSVRDIACIHNEATEEAETTCEWCRSIINYEPNKGWNVHLTASEHERAIALFGGSSLTSRQRWRNLQSNLRDSPHVQWARLKSPTLDPIEALPCSEEEWRLLFETVQEGSTLSVEQELALQQGVLFVDGSVLRQLQDTWYLNDVPLNTLNRPVLMPMLCKKEMRLGWNLPALFLGLNACAPMDNQIFGTDIAQYQQRRIQYPTIRSHYRPLASMLVWLSNRLQLDRTVGDFSEACLPSLAWAHDIQRRLFIEQPQNLFAVFQNALAHHPPGLFEHHDVPWMNAWRSLEDTNRHPRTLNWSVQTSTRRVNFRVRMKTGKTRLIQIPFEPSAWALMISLAMSPLNSDAGKLLLALQHNWSVPYLEPSPPSEPLVKSLQFCHQIMNGLSDRVHLQHATALVFGKLGHVYEVRVGHGQHGAPYSIKHVNGLESDFKQQICIHSGRYHHRVPLGDTMGGVLLSMVNDVKASEDIQSLEEILRSFPPFGFARRPPGAWLAALDQEPLQRFRNRHTMYGARHWFDERQQQRLSDDEEPMDHMFGGVAFMQWQRRRLERNARREQINPHWHEQFETSFDRSGTFPYDNLVAAWRPTVREYTPRNNEHLGGFFGRRMERMMRRYHQLMPHRRGDDLHEQGDIRDGERRWCEVFARLWEVLMLQPLGAYLQVPRRQGRDLRVEHTGLRITMRNALERTFVSQMARLLGYVADGEDETHRTFVRRDHPRHDARLRLTDLLRNAQERQGIRGAPPRWWNYADVCTPPNAMPDVRWELQVDLTDVRQRPLNLQGRNNARGLRFNGPGDFVD